MRTMTTLTETQEVEKPPKATSKSIKITQPDGVTLKRSPRRSTIFGETSGSDVTHDVTTDKSDTYIQTGTKSKTVFENTYKTDPETTFKVNSIKSLVLGVLEEKLRDVEYDPIHCKRLSQELAALIMDRIKALAIRRYKLVAVVSIGSLKEKPGMQFGSRCLWNKGTDSFVSIKYSNDSLFAITMVYGLYYE